MLRDPRESSQLSIRSAACVLYGPSRADQLVAPAAVRSTNGLVSVKATDALPTPPVGVFEGKGC
jgi:hypothetical protein